MKLQWFFQYHVIDPVIYLKTPSFKQFEHIPSKHNHLKAPREDQITTEQTPASPWVCLCSGSMSFSCPFRKLTSMITHTPTRNTCMFGLSSHGYPSYYKDSTTIFLHKSNQYVHFNKDVHPISWINIDVFRVFTIWSFPQSFQGNLWFMVHMLREQLQIGNGIQWT